MSPSTSSGGADARARVGLPLCAHRHAPRAPRAHPTHRRDLRSRVHLHRCLVRHVEVDVDADPGVEGDDA